MSAAETGRILLIKEIAPGHWLGKCYACPGRGDGRTADSVGRFQCASHNHAEQWWVRHKETESHKIYANKTRPTAEEELLGKIFGGATRAEKNAAIRAERLAAYNEIQETLARAESEENQKK